MGFLEAYHSQNGKKKALKNQGFCNHFGRLNLSLAGCSPAEPTSVSIQHNKIQLEKLYLQPVKFPSHLPNPFEKIENRLDKLERILTSLKPEEQQKNRFVNLDEFSKYSGLSKNTVYAKLSRGDGIPGSFKAGPKLWLFDLDEWDHYLKEKKSRWS